MFVNSLVRLSVAGRGHWGDHLVHERCGRGDGKYCAVQRLAGRRGNSSEFV